MNDILLVHGKAVVTGHGQVIPGGGIAISDGRIVGVGKAEEMRRKFAGARERAFSGCALLPGLVNGHCHLELGYMRGRIPQPGHFTEWVRELMSCYPGPERLEAVVNEAVRVGANESLRYGVTTVGDISRQCRVTRRALTNGPLRVVSFGEVVGLGKMRGRLDGFLNAAAESQFASEWLTVGLSPHAPYTVEGPALEAVARRAIAEKLPVAMHLGELKEEEDFLRNLGGPLGREWDVMLKMDMMDEGIPLFAGGPVRWAERYGLLGEKGAGRVVPVVLAHGNYCDAGELEVLARSGASVAYCPRTRAYFGHEETGGPHPFLELLERGVNVCLGTDSLASNPDLSLLREAQFLKRLRPETPTALLLEMMTIRGAQALGMTEKVGSLAEGKEADMIAIPLAEEDGETEGRVMEAIIREAREPESVWVRGKEVWPASGA